MASLGQRFAAKQDAPVTAGGLAKSALTKLRESIEGTIGSPTDLVNWELTKAQQLAKTLGWQGGADMAQRAQQDMMQPDGGVIPGVPDFRGPTSGEAHAFTDRAYPDAGSQEWISHQPENRAEKFAGAVGGFAGDALLPGGPMRKAANVLIPALTSEAAGQGAEALGASPTVENAARIGVGLGFGGLTSKIGTDRALQQQLSELIDSGPAGVNRAKQLMLEQGMSPADVESKMLELGPRSMVVDTGQNFLQEGQQIMARGGPGRPTLLEALEQRADTRSPALNSALEDSIGVRKQPSDIQEAFGARKEAIGPEYDAAHAAQAKPADTAGLLNSVEAQLAATKSGSLRSKLQQVRKSLHLQDAEGIPKAPDPATGEVTPQLDPSSSGLHEARKALDDMLYDRDLPPNEKRVLSQLRKEIDTELGAVGPIKDVDAKYAQVAKEEDAFDQGQQVYKNEQGMPTEVEFKRNFDAMSPGEQTAVLDGINVETWRQAGINSNDLATLKKTVKGEGKWNYEKIAAVVGKDKAKTLMNTVKAEAKFADTENKIAQGSRTAPSMTRPESGESFMGTIAKAAPEAAAALVFDPSGATSTALSASHLRRYLTERLRGGRGGEAAIDSDVSNILTSSQPETLTRAIEILGNPRKALDKIPSSDQIATLLSGLVARQREEEMRKQH